MNKVKKLGMSFVYAFKGIMYCIRHERNIRIHIVALVYVIFFSLFYSFSKTEYTIIILTCAFVISAELFNTAIEVVIDKVSPKFSVFAMVGKDIAAGAVLISAAAAVAVGVFLFYDANTIKEIFSYFISEWYRAVIFIISAVLSGIFIGKTKRRGGKAAKMVKEKEK